MTDTTTINPGVRGHTRSTWRDESHLRGMLLRLMTQHPDITHDELEAKYLAKAKRTPALVDEALRRAFDNDLARVQQPPVRQRPRRAEAEVAAATERVRNVVLLDLILPTGKKLRDSTGPECIQAGGWLTKVGERVGGAIVGATLNETEVASIFASGTRR